MAQTMKDVLIQLLNGIASPNNEHRTYAEQQLKVLENQQGYGVALAQISLDSTFPVPIRQLSSITLKKYVKTHWDELQDEEPENEESNTTKTPNVIASMEDKMAIKQLLAQGLSDPQPKIRTAVAMAIGVIASWDWPDHWPNFLDDLVNCLRSNNLDLLSGAIRCLEIFIDKDNLDDQQLPILVKVLFPEMWRIFNSPGGVSDRIRMRAISVIHSLINWLSLIKEAHKQDTNMFFQNVITGWFGGLTSVLKVPDTPTADCGLPITVMKVLYILVNEFPKQMKPHVPALMGPIWTALVDGLQIYEKAAVHSDLLGDTAQDSDGEVLGFESLVSLLWEFVHVLLDKKSIRNLLKSNLTGLVYVAIGYMQITADQEDTWESDPNQYVADEEDIINSFSVRLSATTLIGELVETFEIEAIKAIVQAVTKRIEESVAAKQNGHSQWWKLREASILALGSVPEIQQHPELFDLSKFMASVLSEDLSQGSSFLKGRSIWCASIFANAVPADYAVPFLTAAASTLQPTSNDPFPVKVGACKALASFCPKLNLDLLKPYLPSMITGIAALIPTATEDTLHLVLDTLLVVIKVDTSVTAQFEASLTPYFLAVWSKYSSDPLIKDIVTELLDVMARCPGKYSDVESRLLPVATTILNNASDLPGLTETSISILQSLVNASPDPISEPLLTRGFPLLVTRVLHTDDSSIMQNGATCLSAFVRKASGLLITWKPDGNTVALQFVMQVIAKLLNPSVSDSAALYVGTLINKLIASLPDHVGSFLGDMLRAVLARLEVAQMPSLIQPLILIFARLFNTNTNEVISFLDQVQTSKGTNGLVYVMTTWTRWHEEFQGAYNIKQSCVALAKLLRLQDQRIDNLTVPGERVVDTKQGIVTRSSALKDKVDQWTQVPLRVKILTLLVREHAISVEEADVAEEEEEEDEDYEDDEFGESTKDNYLQQLGLSSSTKFIDASLFFPGDEDWDDVDEDEDPDAKNDPIYQINLKNWLEEYLRAFAKEDANGLINLGRQLAQNDQQCLQQIVTKS